MTDRHLVPIHPRPQLEQACPLCASAEVDVEGIRYPGIHIMAEKRCRACGTAYLQDAPVGFAVDNPTAIDRATGKLINGRREVDWLQQPLLNAYSNPQAAPVKVERIVYRECRRVIVLNTLDFLYGHVLLKLYNAAHYLQRYPDLGLIVIVPRMFQWLVPQGVAEAWVVDLRLGAMHGWYEALDTELRTAIERYEEVFLGRGYAHPEFEPIDIARFTGVPPFPLEEFTKRPPHITFVAREDRLWFATPLGKFIHRVLNKLGLRNSLGRWYVAAQDRLMRRTMRAIKARMPDVTFTVVGLGRGGNLADVATDLRTTRMNDDVERAWVKAYAVSQIVVGVHGSNMLLPTAHAAGCIEILPYDRYGNIVQDVSVRWHDRMQIYLYRFVDEFASPRAVARHAVAMLGEFGNYYRNNRINIFGPGADRATGTRS